MRVSVALLVGLVVCGACSASPLRPVVANGGFEDCVVGKVNDAPGWAWSSNIPAAFSVADSSPHSGSRCIVLTNQAFASWWMGARVYQNVPVLPGVRYEASVWVRGDGVGKGQAFGDWRVFGVGLPSGTFGWRKITSIFRTHINQTACGIGVSLSEKCRALAVDDFELRAIGEPIEGPGISGSYVVPSVVDGNGAAFLGVRATSARKSASTLRCTIKAGDAMIFDKSAPIKPGENTIEWEWNSGSVTARKLVFSLRVADANGRVIASAKQDIEKRVPENTKATMQRVEALYKGDFADLYGQCAARGIALDYPTTTRALMDQFIPFVHEDLKGGDNLRADYEAIDLERVLNDSISDMRAYLKDPKTAPVARKYRTSKMEIDGLSLVADRVTSSGKADRGPVFFCGYGHFVRVRKDIPLFPDYGVNIIQIEIGPAQVLPEENKIDYEALRSSVVQYLDDAAKHNIKVNVLLSPHYFPQWARAKWPVITRGGYYFAYDSPEAMDFMRQYVNAVIPVIKDHPALHSVCLDNEPYAQGMHGADNTKKLWSDYLKQAHGDVATMNAHYGTDYASFDDVPVCGNQDYSSPRFYDWCTFNDTRFGDWHKWYADEIHKIAPNLPVHSKIMGLVHNTYITAGWGVDLEKFGAATDMNGNDCACWPGGGGWGITWRDMNNWYDMQRSLNRKPIFNSENHISVDSSIDYLPSENFRFALWQGAIHGQASTTIWVWERTPDRGNCLYGNVMQRPGCAHAVSRTTLDLNRFAEHVVALQNVKAPAAIVYSRASFFRGPAYQECRGRVYDALNFCGVKVDFISEKQLAEGQGAQYKLIILPNTTNLLPSTIAALPKLRASTKLMILGGTIRDPYGKAYDLRALRSGAITFPANADAEKTLWPALLRELGKLNALPEVSVVDAKTGRPAWGVEWLTAEVSGRTVVNIVNLTDKPKEVRVLRGGKPIDAKDLLSLGGRESVKHLKPIVPVLAGLAQ